MERPASTDPLWKLRRPNDFAELMKAQGVRRTSFEDLRSDLFGSDAELEAFLATAYAARDAS